MPETSAIARRERHAGHYVQFYEGDDNFIYDAVAEFFVEGLHAGQPVVFISTPAHRSSVFEILSLKGFDTSTLTWLDARELLSTFMVDGMPDDVLFRTSVGKVFQNSRAGSGHESIRAFGEMVDLLLRDGNPEAALRLEELWNDLGRVYGFSLLCAYAIGNLYREDHWRYFQKICDQHAPVHHDQHISPADIQQFALRKALLSPSQLVHFSDCDLCSELWWRVKQAAKTSPQKTA
jgi:hypothetical protein